MEYRRLGRTGVQISKVSLGTMAFGRWIDEKASADILYKALDLGINVVDTADIYGRGMDNGNFDQLGESETILGNILKQKRKDVLISTKLNNRMGPFINDRGQSRHHIFRAVEASLQRLQTDTIDILHVHRFDPNSTFEESLRALDDLISQGKIRYIACSNFAAWQVAKAHGVSALHHFARYESIQAEYSLISRQIEQEILPFAKSEQVGILAYSPLGRGILAGKYSSANPPPKDSRLAAGEVKLKELIAQKHIFEYVDALDDIAKQIGWSLPQLAFNWVANHPDVTSAILGASKLSHLEEALKYVDHRLTNDELELINNAYQI
ncbi:aldo/keto reductase [Sporosarcina sp. FSL W7-1349]|uniref:aldo/keto reductase n=1 Tax=Sporosarcina sp. FSL W7-1349 TaxID=2921561 RepID=UPI0030FCD1DF